MQVGLPQILIWVLQEADAKMGLNVQEMYLEKCL